MQLSFTRVRATVARISIITAALLALVSSAGAADPLRSANADITGVVTDAGSGQPLPSAEVSIMRGTEVVSNVSTDSFGRYTAHNIAPGTYTVTARFLGFSPQSKTITVGDGSGDIKTDFVLNAVAINLQGVTVTASVPLAVDTPHPRSCSNRSPAPPALQRVRSTFAASTLSTPTTSTACRCPPEFLAASMSCSSRRSSTRSISSRVGGTPNTETRMQP